jgi:CRP-like cAMP-binding protein
MIQTFESVGLAAKPKTLKQELEQVLPASSRAASLLAQLEKNRFTSDIVASLWERLRPEDKAQLKAQLEPTTDTDLMEYLERKDVEAGHYLIRQGDVSKALYFIEAGQVTVQLECRGDDDRVVRLRTMGAGTVVGEMGLYLERRASASVVTDQPSTFYRLSVDNLKRMEEIAPEIAAAFHRFVARVLGERLADANDTLQALLD